MNASFWIDAPREGFAARCVAEFGVGFDAGSWIENSERISDRSQRKSKSPGISTDFASRSRNFSVSSGNLISKNAMKRAGALL